MNALISRRVDLTGELIANRRPEPASLDNTDTMDLVDMVQGMRRRWKQICGFVAVGFFIAFGWLFFLAEDKFTTTAVLVLEVAPAPALELGGLLPGLTGGSSAINTELEILQARTLIGRVVDGLNLQNSDEFNGVPSPNVLQKNTLWMLTRLGIAPQNPERVSDTARLNLAIDAVLENLTVANVSDSQILEVTMASRSPKLASKIANSLVI